MLAGADERRRPQVLDCKFVAEAVAASTRVKWNGQCARARCLLSIPGHRARGTRRIMACVTVIVMEPATYRRPEETGDPSLVNRQINSSSSTTVGTVPARVATRVSVRSSRYPTLRQSGKHRRTASRSGPGALPCTEDIDRCWPSTTPASAWPGRMSVPRRPNAYRPGKRSAIPVSGRHGSRASIVEQRADPVRAPSLRRDINRCGPSTTPASGWPRPMSIPGSPNAYPTRTDVDLTSAILALW